MNEIDEFDEFDDNQEVRDKMELQNLIDQLPFNDLMNVDEFLHIDDSLKNNGGLTDNEIVSMVKNNNGPETDPNEGPLEIISKREALSYLDDLFVFFEYSPEISTNSNELGLLKKLRHQVLTSYIDSSKQITLDSFIQIL